MSSIDQFGPLDNGDCIFSVAGSGDGGSGRARKRAGHNPGHFQYIADNHISRDRGKSCYFDQGGIVIRPMKQHVSVKWRIYQLLCFLLLVCVWVCVDVCVCV